MSNFRSRIPRDEIKISTSDRAILRSNNLNLIHPDLRAIVEHAFQIAPKPFIVTQGLRTIYSQSELWMKGRVEFRDSSGVWHSKNEGKVTSTIIGSDHLTGLAVDLAPFPYNSKLKPADYQYIIDAMKKSAQEFGLELDVGAEWKSKKDTPHFALRSEERISWLLGPTQANSYLYTRPTWSPWTIERYGLLERESVRYRLMETDRLFDRQLSDTLNPRDGPSRSFLPSEKPRNPENPRSDRRSSDEAPEVRGPANRPSDENLFDRFERGREYELPARNDFWDVSGTA